jgi:SAM-dependent methyltransferase
MREWVEVRRDTWTRLTDYLTREGLINSPKRTMDIGGKGTTIFLALRDGERYAVDPVYRDLFQVHPFLKELKEYQGVNFLAAPVEDITIDQPFDTIFCINVLDHMAELDTIIAKIEELLAPSGTLVLVIDCYADRAVRNLIRWFDVDLPHPHHFLAEDILRLFSRLELRKQDPAIFRLFLTGRLFRGAHADMPVYRLGRLLGRAGLRIRASGKRWNLPFVAKFSLAYSLALLLALLRRKEAPIYPLKKPRLYVFQKPGRQ